MATTNCWCCGEISLIHKHDCDYHLICIDCQDDYPLELSDIIDTTVRSNELTVALVDYQQAYDHFLSQKADRLAFFTDTKGLPWRLQPGGRDQAVQPDHDLKTWSEYYSASLKEIALIEEHYRDVKNLLDIAIIPTLPLSSLTPLQIKIINLAVYGDQVDKPRRNKVVVSEYYFTTIESFQDSPHWAKLNWLQLSQNDNLTLNWLVKHPDWPWVWDRIHKASNFDLSWYEAFPTMAWNHNCINRLKFHLTWPPPVGVLWADYFRVVAKYSVSWLTIRIALDQLVNQPALPLDWISFIDLTPGPTHTTDEVWQFLVDYNLVNWLYLSQNATLAWRWLLQHPNLPWGTTDESVWINLSCNPSISAEIMIMLYQNALTTGIKTAWARWALSRNSSFNVAWLNQPWYDLSVNLPGRNWEWNSISKHPSATLEFIQQNPWWDWQFDYFRINPNFNLTWLQAIPSPKWGMRALASRPDFDLALIAGGKVQGQDYRGHRYLELSDWPWYQIARRSDLTWVKIAAYPEIAEQLPWSVLCQQPQLAWDHPLWWNNSDKWHRPSLSQNPATTWDEVFKYDSVQGNDENGDWIGWDWNKLCQNAMVVL